MAFAILKLSYNQPGESSLTGGICGTGFFIDDTTAISAHHVLNEDIFTPNAGFRFCRVWILSRSGAITAIDYDSLKSYPEIDTAVLKFQKPPSGYNVYTLSDQIPDVGSPVLSIGYIGNTTPQVEAHWEGESLVLSNLSLNSVFCDEEGYIKNHFMHNVKERDVKLQDIEVFEVSFSSRVGMSGGPLINRETNEVIGLLSMGYPRNSDIKAQTFSITASEIKKRILSAGT